MEKQSHPLPDDALGFINVCLESARKNPDTRKFFDDRMAAHKGAKMVFNILRAGCMTLALRGAMNLTADSPVSGTAQLVVAAALHRYIARDIGRVADANLFMCQFAKQNGMETTVRILKASRANVPPSQIR